MPHHHGAPSGAGTPALCLVRVWAVAAVVLVVTQLVLTTLVRDRLVGPEGVRSFGAALALVHLPDLVCVTLAAWAASRAHPEPWRNSPVRHAAACCTVPTAAQVLTLCLTWDRAGFTTLACWMSTGVLLAGCALGVLPDGWRETAPRRV
ncbi:hypothetical protein ACFYOV_13555 [Streptomyces sp. NPDC005931]|uniref:hypothetical protein n=1 Tax=Streptomyces sp. NPDC005931 TaxID=3364737 RepID=UPI0036CA390C